MTFAAMPLATWATLFAGIGGAVTLLYLLRLRRRRIEVPFGPLWEKVLSEKQTTSLFRVLKRLFSLLLQLAFIALILTAIADPRWTGEGGVEYKEERLKEPSHTLLVVDTSASMAATDVHGGRAAAASAAAHRVVDAMLPTENVMLAHLDRDIAVITDWTDDGDTIHKAINRLRSVHAGTDIGPLMQFARNALRGLNEPQVVLVTDRGFTPPDNELATAIRLKVIDVGQATGLENVAILDFNVRSHLGNALKYALYYKLKNYADRPVKVAVYLHSSDTGSTRGDFAKVPPVGPPTIYELGPLEEKVVEQLGVDLSGRRVALILELEQDTGAAPFVDVLPVDDVAFAVVPKRKELKVQIVGPENLFLEAALIIRSNVTVDRVPAAAFQSSEGYDLTVFNGVSPAGERKGNAIYVNARGDDMPFKVKGTARGGSLSVPGLRRRHALMKFVRFVDLSIPKVQRFKLKKGQIVMARSRGGKPAIVAHSGAEQRWVAVGFDPVASEWVGHYSFSIFFVNAVNWFFNEEAKLLRPWSLAERWDVPLPWRGIDHVKVTQPTGETVTALVDAGGMLAFTGRHEGIYEVRHPHPTTKDQEDVVLVAASLKSAAESSLQAQGEYAVWEAPEAQDAETPTLSLMGASLWQLLLVIAVLLMVLEWFTYHRRWTV